MASEKASITAADQVGSGVGAYRPTLLKVGSVYNFFFFVSGKPIAKARPRTTKTGHTYTPDTTVTWEQSIGWQVREQLSRLAADGVRIPMPLEGRVIAEMRFNFDKPKSTPKRVQHKLKKPDYDNLAKSITDVLQAGDMGVGVFRDDSQVTDCIILKRFASEGHPQGVEIELHCWEA